jgi:hypothetical protein
MLVDGCRPEDGWLVVDTTDSDPKAAASALESGVRTHDVPGCRKLPDANSRLRRTEPPRSRSGVAQLIEGKQPHWAKQLGREVGEHSRIGSRRAKITRESAPT